MSTKNLSQLKIFHLKQRRLVGSWDDCLNLTNTFNQALEFFPTLHADVKKYLSTRVGDWALTVNYVVVVFILVA